MKAFVLSNSEVLGIVRRSSETFDQCDLFTGIMQSRGCTPSSYMYNVMSVYMTNYVLLPDHSLSIFEHNTIYNEFQDSVHGMDICNMEIMAINHVDSMVSFADAFIDQGFCSSMYEDTYRFLEDHYNQVHGAAFVEFHQSSVYEDLDRLMNLTCYTAKEIESRYLSYRDDSHVSYVLFAMKDDHLVVFVH